MAGNHRLAGIADLLVGIGLALALAGCSSTQPTVRRDDPPGGYNVSRDPWVLTCTDPTDPTPALLWNGLIGVRIGRDGTGYGPDAGQLFMHMIDGYEQTGEEKMLPLPNPLAYRVKIGQDSLKPQAGKPYRQSLDLKTGILETGFECDTDSNSKVAVDVLTAIHPNRRAVAQRWTVQSVNPYSFTFGRLPAGYELAPNSHSFATGGGGSDSYFALDGRVHARISTDKTMPNKSGEVTYEHVVEFGPFRAWPYEKRAFRPAKELSFSEVAAASEIEWRERWKTDIEIDGPVEDQQAIRSFLFYSRSAIHPDGGMSISPFGLSNALYNGHVFWDADMWVFPALAFIATDAAKAISDYRLFRLRSADSNFLDWNGSGRPTATHKLGKMAVDCPTGEFLMYPWESAKSGRETTPERSRFQHHITGSVVFSLGMAASLNLAPQDLVSHLILRAGTSYFARSEPLGKQRVINGVMSPDENYVGDNDLYTNLLAQWCVNGGDWDSSQMPANTRVHVRDAVFKLPRDEHTFLTYDNDALRAYYQAAAVLSIYPLQYPRAEKEAGKMMDRFAGKIAENGPAMSESIHATIWARLGETEKAYESWRKSWQRYTNHPLMLFSERPKSGETYFTTGAAGCLNAVIYGFLGFRIDDKKQPGAVWSKQLLGARWLSIKPNLPKAWTSVKFKNFKVLGKSYTLTVTHKGAQVTQGER